MTNDTDWVEDVKRWYLAGGAKANGAEAGRDSDRLAGDYGDDVGYEAAHPALQACHWPDAVAFTTDR